MPPARSVMELHGTLRSVTWSSSSPSVASINSSGVVLSLSKGTTNITAVFEGVTGSAQVTVNSAILQSIAISPTQTVLPPGKTINYSAIGTFSNGSTYGITGKATWSSSDPTLVQFLSPGIATTLKPGPTVTVQATYQQPGGNPVTSNNASVIVTQFPLVSISV